MCALKLQFKAIQNLMPLLKPQAMSAIYLMGLGKELPESVSKSDLTEVISVLCKRLDWIEGDLKPGPLVLKFKAIQILMSELQPGEMGAIYLLGLGKEMPETVTKMNLIKIMDLLFKQLDWVEAGQGSNKSEDVISPVNGHSEVVTSSTQDTKATERNAGVQLQFGKPKPFSCSQCDKRFETAEHLTEHKRIHLTHSVHDTKPAAKTAGDPLQIGKQKPFSCSQCILKFDSVYYLREHEKMHTGEKNLKCSYCDFKTNWRSNFSTHQRACKRRRARNSNGFVNTRKSEQTSEKVEKRKAIAVDNLASKPDNASGTLNKVIRIDHAAPINNDPQNLQYTVLNGINVIWHDPEELIRLDYEEPVHPLQVGNISSSMNNEANSHNRQQRSSSANIQQIISQLAPVRPEQPIISRSLLAHPSDERAGKKPFKCHHCDKTFTSAWHLTNHERVHTGERPFKCSYCSMAFTRKQTEERHEKTCSFKPTHSGEKTLSSSLSEKTFMQRHEEISLISTAPNTGDIQIIQHATEPVIPDNPSSKVSAEGTDNTTSNNSNSSKKSTETSLEELYRLTTGTNLPKCLYCNHEFADQTNKQAHEKTCISRPRNSGESLLSDSGSLQSQEEVSHTTDTLISSEPEAKQVTLNPLATDNPSSTTCAEETSENSTSDDSSGPKKCTETLLETIEIVEMPEKPYSCSKCDEKFELKKDWEIHDFNMFCMARRNKPDNSQVDILDQPTKSSAQLSNIVNQSLNPPDSPMNSTLDMTEIITPSNKVDKNSTPVFFAKKSKPSPPPVESKDAFANEEDKPHSCSKCGMTFQCKEDWEIHDFNMFCMTLQ